MGRGEKKKETERNAVYTCVCVDAKYVVCLLMIAASRWEMLDSDASEDSQTETGRKKKGDVAKTKAST